MDCRCRLYAPCSIIYHLHRTPLKQGAHLLPSGVFAEQSGKPMISLGNDTLLCATGTASVSAYGVLGGKGRLIGSGGSPGILFGHGTCSLRFLGVAAVIN